MWCSLWLFWILCFLIFVGITVWTHRDFPCSLNHETNISLHLRCWLQASQRDFVVQDPEIELALPVRQGKLYKRASMWTQNPGFRAVPSSAMGLLEKILSWRWGGGSNSESLLCPGDPEIQCACLREDHSHLDFFLCIFKSRDKF